MSVDGKIVMKPSYMGVLDFAEGLARVWKGGLFGFVNRRGEEVIPCKYELAMDFAHGAAAVRIGDKWGYIDRAGEWLVEPVYDKIDLRDHRLFRHGFTTVIRDGVEWLLAVLCG